MKTKAGAFLSAFLLLSTAASADVSKTGSEFQINAVTTGYQRQASAAATAAGEFVVVWVGPYSEESDPEVRGRRIGASGLPEGDEFLVNLNTEGRHNRPVVDADADGNFVVAWTSSERDGDGYGVFGQRFDASAAPVGTEFRANTTTAEDQRRAAVAVSDDGSFVVVWESTDQDGEDGGIFAQRFDAGAAPLGTEFRVNTFTAGSQYIPQVEALAGGGFVVAWGSDGQDDPQDAFGAGVFAQRYDQSGAPAGTEFQVNTYTTDTQSNVAIAARSDGGFTMVWEDFEQDSSGHGVFARRYASSGAALGTAFQLDDAPTGNQFRPQAGPAPDNGFVALWHDDTADGDGTGVFARAFGGDGAAAGASFQVNTETADDQFDPTIAAHDDGEMLVTWSSTDVDFGNILGQRLTSSGVAPGTCGDPTGGALSVASRSATLASGRRQHAVASNVLPRVVTASDALAVLRTAVGSLACALCVCDVDNSGAVSATDALITLKAAVGQAVDLDCPACT